MRYPLALKVSGWLLLNLVLLVALAAGLLVVQGGFNWNALVEGPPGRRVQDLAEATLSTLRSVPRERRDEVLAEFSKTHGIFAAVIGASGQRLTGDALDLPPALAEMVRPQGPPPDRFESGEPEDRPPPPPPGKRRPRLLIRDGDPAVFWLAVRINTPERPPSVIVMRIPTFGVLLKLLDLAPWLWAGAAAIGVSLLFWLPFVRSLTRDLGRLNRATEAIADGRFDARVPEDRRDELGELGGSVNRMAGRLDRLVAGQKRFLGDIAHELGSPIGRMQVSVEILEQRADPALHNAINDVREEIDHMSALVGELLAFTKAGLKARDAVLVPVALTQLADRALAREAADDAVTVNLAPSLHVRADADLLARAVGNLVRNAL
ncbi:MAG: HAMP domain-containing histidine kinase, partial [Sphingomonadaceae bacterium]|nr:HAMP domain-containing histidine kinase [Sphingomonadaceae bacterium]